MKQYCLRTCLVEKPSVCFYYKGIEDDTTVFNALNAVVSLSLDDALVLDGNAARRLCKRLNEDVATLLAHGYSEFEITKKANSV